MDPVPEYVWDISWNVEDGSWNVGVVVVVVDGSWNVSGISWIVWDGAWNVWDGSVCRTWGRILGRILGRGDGSWDLKTIIA